MTSIKFFWRYTAVFVMIVKYGQSKRKLLGEYNFID